MKCIRGLRYLNAQKGIRSNFSRQKAQVKWARLKLGSRFALETENTTRQDREWFFKLQQDAIDEALAGGEGGDM